MSYKNILKTTGALSFLGTSVACCVYSTKPKINLVLDLDETLIHSKPTEKNTQNFKPFKSADFPIADYNVWKRPYTNVFFTVMKPFCNFYLYTSADKEYADEIITKAGWNNHFSKRRYFDTTYDTNGCKDVGVFNLWSSHKTILVDDRDFNDCHTLSKNYRFIHIPPYKLYNSADKELLKLACKVVCEFYTQ